MNEKQPTPPSQAAANLEREIRDGRKFSLAEAIGRLAGPGMMKGVSPATRKQQAEAVIANYVERHLGASELSHVLIRQVKESELLLNNLDQPLVVLAAYTERILGNAYLLQELVRESDVEWGRVRGERPIFQREGAPPREDDPYTIESVGKVLSQLIETLAASDELNSA